MKIPTLSLSSQFVIGASLLGYGIGVMGVNNPLGITCAFSGGALVITVLVRCAYKYG